MALSSVQITGTGQLLDLSRRLRAVSGAPIQRNMARRVRRAAEPLHRDMQDVIRNLRLAADGRRAGSRGGPSPTRRPFRATLAEAVRISVRTGGNPGARIYVDKGRLPRDISVGVLYQLNDGRLRHPVFGNRSRWTNQRTTPMWWDRTVRQHTPRMQSEVARVLDDVRRQLE
ncbi:MULTISPECIES: hypothetical protein [Streptomyces]|uniref:hypothetical protein n=1 Tax=Streptomyces TaxID=1883 RepID=UPI00204EB9E3|nr:MULTISPECIES: hypothetical protein [Streptomyces]UPT41769.1 hypothetical protein MWG59_10210 [Streptomyces sp. WAC00303]WIY76001.1 hypothetical protein QPM16_10070 [Streptomyces anulatus]